MQAPQLRVATGIVLSSLLLLVSACGAGTEPISQVTSVPEGVEVVNVTEAETVNSEITQHKTFNQCSPASPFKAQIQFSDSSSQGNQQTLVLKASAGGEAGISQVAQLKLEGAIEQHFASSITRGQAHQETATIEVPPYTQQEYTIVWRETRRTGIVKYKENGRSETANYSYRIGLELVSAAGKDIPCPGQATAPRPQPTNMPTIVMPTSTPVAPPTSTPLADTLPNTILEVGQVWRQGGAEVLLKDVSLTSSGGTGILFKIYFTNRKPQDISFGYSIDNFTAIDNRERRRKIWYTGGFGWEMLCDPQTKTVSTGQTVALSCANDTFLAEAQIGDVAVTEIIITVSGISSISEARWRVPIYH